MSHTLNTHLIPARMLLLTISAHKYNKTLAKLRFLD